MLYPIAVEKGSNEEALSNAKEAIADHLEILAEDGKNIPLASEVSKFLNDEEFKGFIWAVLDVDVNRYLGKAEKINVTLPRRLIYLIEDKVGKDKQYKTRSAAAGAEKILQASSIANQKAPLN